MLSLKYCILVFSNVRFCDTNLKPKFLDLIVREFKAGNM
jgi:hypothetical protein